MKNLLPFKLLIIDEDSNNNGIPVNERHKKKNANEKYENYKILKKTIEETFKKETDECIQNANKEIELLLIKNRNFNLNKSQKVGQIRDQLLEGFKKLL